MRTTKAMLEHELDIYKREIREVRRENQDLRKMIAILERPREHLASLVVATERVTDSLAHVVDVLTRRKNE